MAKTSASLRFNNKKHKTLNTIKNFRSKGWQFVGLVVILSIIPYYFILKEGTSDSPFTLLLMWIPAISSVVLRLVHKEKLFKGIVWNPFKDFRWLLLAIFIPLIIEFLSLMVTYLLGAAELKPNLIIIEKGLISLKGVAMVFGAQPQPWYILVPHYLLSYFLGTVFYSLIFTLGEEYGWRGYLQKEWSPNNNLNGFVAIGIVWGLWHLPAILQGHNYPEYPIIGAFILMPILCIIFSIVFGIVYNRKHVIWIAVAFHGALNISADVSNTAFIEESINRPINDVIWTSLWLITALIFWSKLKLTNKNNNEIN